MTALDEMISAMQAMGIDADKDSRIFQMGSQQLGRRIRNACSLAGLDGRYGGISPRIGMAMDLAMTGLYAALRGPQCSNRRPTSRPADGYPSNGGDVVIEPAGAWGQVLRPGRDIPSVTRALVAAVSTLHRKAIFTLSATAGHRKSWPKAR